MRDKVIEQLVQNFDKPDFDHKRPGGWFEERIKELVDEEKKKGPPAEEKKKKPRKKRAVSEVE